VSYGDDWAGYFITDSLDDGSDYDDGYDRYLGDPDEDYPRGGYDCE
jgi:hypothetical protein